MILEAILVAGFATAPTAPPPPDPFFGEDKVKHFVTSFVVTSLAVSGGRAVGLDRRDSLAAGAGVSLALGVGKEINDSRRGQFFSVRDLLWDIAGTGTSVVLLDRSR